MLVGFAGLLAGYDGNFEFKSGEVYPDNVPFVAMRVILATFGVGMVPLAWYTAVELGMSQWSCHLTALMVLLGKPFIFEAAFFVQFFHAQISAGYAYLGSFSWILCFYSSRS